MKVLVTGGLGFLGSNVAAAAATAGCEVAILDNNSRLGSTENRKWLQSLGLELQFFHGDIRCRQDVDRLIAAFKPECVFHFAGQVAMTSSLEDPRTDFEINAIGTLNVLEALKTLIKASSSSVSLFYSSTNKVYGDLDWVRWGENSTRHIALDFPNGFDESLPLDFRTPYGCSKGSADQMILDYSRRIEGLNASVFRHSSMYGPRQYATENQGWIGWFCSRAGLASVGAGSEFTVSGDGKQVRDLLHANDMAALYMAALARPEAVSGRAFNVGGGMEMSLSVNELLGELESLAGVQLQRRHIPARSSDQKVFVADTSAVRKSLGWSPKVGIKTGLEDMLAWCGHLRASGG